MRKILPILIGVMVLFAVQPAKALTGETYIETCKALTEESGSNIQRHLQDYSGCIAYTSAIRDTVDLYESIFGICINKNITHLQLVTVAVRNIKNFPEKWHYNPVHLIIPAWQKAWPCK